MRWDYLVMIWVYGAICGAIGWCWGVHMCTRDMERALKGDRDA